MPRALIPLVLLAAAAPTRSQEPAHPSQRSVTLTAQVEAAFGNRDADAAKAARAALLADPEAAVDAVIERLRDPDVEDGQAMAYFLARHLADPALRPLCREARNPRSPARTFALVALCFFRSDDRNAVFQREAPLAAIAALGSPEATVAVAGFNLMAGVAHHAVDLDTRISDPPPLGPRLALIFEQGRGRGQVPLPALLAAMRDPVPALRIRALYTLAARPEPQAAETLAAHLTDADPQVAQAVAVQIARGLGDLAATEREATVTLLQAWIARPLGAITDRTTQTDLRRRGDVLTQAAAHGAVALPLLTAALELPVPADPFVAFRVDDVRLASLRALATLGTHGRPLFATVLDMCRDRLDRFDLQAEGMRALTAMRVEEPEQRSALASVARAVFVRTVETTEEPRAPRGWQREFVERRETLVAAAAGALAGAGPDAGAALDELLAAIDNGPAPGAAAAAVLVLAGDRPEVRARALGAVADLREHDDAHGEVLLRALTDDPKAALSLREPLLELATGPEHPLRGAAARVLGRLGEAAKEARAELLRALLAAGRAEHRTSHQRVLARACADLDPVGCVASLEQYGAFDPLLLRAVVDTTPQHIVPLLNHENPHWRSVAEHLLRSYTRGARPAQDAIGALLTRRDLHDPATVLGTLSRIGANETLVDSLVPWLEGRHATLATRCLIQAGVVAWPHLVADFPKRSYEILQSLRNLGSAAAPFVGPLVAARAEFPGHAKFIAEHLPHFGLAGIRAAEPLFANAAAFEAALLNALATGREPTTLRALAQELLSRGVRIDAKSFPAHVRASEDPWLLLLAAHTSPPAKRATELLLHGLADPRAALRAQAARSLANCRDEDRGRARAFLRWSLEDSDARVRDAARAALGAIGK